VTQIFHNGQPSHHGGDHKTFEVMTEKNILSANYWYLFISNYEELQ
jgi:hypothetical protein